jgi:hypothetical protein
MSTYNYPILSYFLQAYWNQNSDILYATPRAAAEDFVKVENDEYCEKLLLELGLAVGSNLIQRHMAWETCSEWWHQHDVLINLEEATQISLVIRQHTGSG